MEEMIGEGEYELDNKRSDRLECKRFDEWRGEGKGEGDAEKETMEGSLFPKGKHSSRKDKENSNVSVATRSLSSVSFRSEKPERSRRRESGSLSRHRYIPPPPLPMPPRKMMASTSMGGYSDDAMTSSSSHTTTTDYEDIGPVVPVPSYVIYPAASISHARRYPTEAMLPSVYLAPKHRIFRSPTYHHGWFNGRTRSIVFLRLTFWPV
uniref:Uncharacterized protein n=1 Tax=Caenorhabditis japonica TaxID=281687 RepID=A0A8R1ES02_CAEJA